MTYTPPGAKSVFSFKHSGTVSTLTGAASDRWLIAGQGTNGATLSSNYTSVVGQQIAMPFYTGRGGNIDSCQVRVVTGTTGNFHVAPYTNTSDSVLYPATQMFSMTDTATTAAGPVGPTNLTWAMPANQLVWFVYQASAAVPVIALPTTAQWAILGYPVDATNFSFPGTCWLNSTTYAALPTTFPSGATPGTFSNLPAVWLRYSS